MKKSCMHQARGRVSNMFIWFFWFYVFGCDTAYMSREEPWHSVNEQIMENPKHPMYVSYGYVGYNMEWEEAHSLAERAMGKDILEGSKGKNCYRSTFVLTGITWQGIGLGKQKNNIVRKKPKDSIRKWEQLRHQRRDKTSCRETLHCHGAWNCSHSVRKQGRNTVWVLFSNCKTKKKKLDEHANKTHRATTRLVLTLLNTKIMNKMFPIKHTWKGDIVNGTEIIAGGRERKVKIFKETKPGLNIHFSELCSKEIQDFSLILSYRTVLCGRQEHG